MLLEAPRLMVDRVDERARFVNVVERVRRSHDQSVIVFVGIPGVGKTALMLWCAEQVESQFDRVLRVSVGASAQARSVEDVLTGFLHELGVELIPPTADTLRAAYRRATSSLNILVLVDDVDTAETLSYAVPASAGSVVVATSRSRLEAFTYRDFDVVRLEALAEEHAFDLLTNGMDPAAVVAQDRGLRRVNELCGHLPLALSIARAYLRTRPHDPVDRYVARLESARSLVAEFVVDDDRELEFVFDASYRELGEPGQRLHRQLGLHPGNQFASWAVAALAGVDDPAEIGTVVGILLRSTLLSQVGEDRYELHSLVHRHALALAEHTDHPADLRAARRRLAVRCLEYVVSRELVLSRQRMRFGALFDGRIVPAYEGERAWALAIGDLELERANVRRIVEMAAADKFHDLVWQIAEAMATFYLQRGEYGDAIVVHGLGLSAAEQIRDATGDVLPLLRMCTELGTAHYQVQDHVGASAFLSRAADLAAEVDARDTTASVVTLAKTWVWKALVHRRQGEAHSAMEAIDRSRRLVADPRFPEHLRGREEALLDLNGGPILAEVGRSDEAIAAGRRSVTYFAARLDERTNHVKALANLGESLSLATPEHHDEAEATLVDAIQRESELGMVDWEAHSRQLAGTLLRRQGRDDEGRAHLERAATLFEELADRRAEALRGLLDDA